MRAILLSGMAAVVFAVTLAAAEPGDSVVVVYNSRLPDSREVATHYAKVRQVPARQVVGLDLPESEEMTRTEYEEQLQKPLLDSLEREKLFVFPPGQEPPEKSAPAQAAFRYLVLCYGVPVRIPDDPAVSEPWDEEMNAIFRGRNGGAVDSELALLPLIRRHYRLTGAIRNPCYGMTNAALINASNGVLIVARLDGPDAQVAGRLVDKAMEAETNGLWGRAYFDSRGLTNGNYKKGDDWIREAADITRRFGFETVSDDQPETFSAAFPMSQIALYAGWYDGEVSGPFTRSEVEFMPGAFAYHLHSFSASHLRSATQNWCGPLLAKGATATMGCVDEPYLEFTPNVEVFFHRWLDLGFTFGEAACAAQSALSWQTTVVGDPLYRPFGGNAQAQYRDLVRRKSPDVEWSILRWVNLNLARGAAVTNYIHLLETEPTTRRSAVLSEKLADLYAANGQADGSVKAFRGALTLHPTPQTVVRLTLDLGGQLAAVGKNDEALRLYEDFLRENPGYPGALALYQKMRMIAMRLGDAGRAYRYAAEINKRSQGQ